MKKLPILVIMTSLIAIFLCYSCQKDPEVVVETIKTTDTLYITTVDTTYITNIDTVLLTLSDTVSTFFLVRHAETTGTGSDPNISPEGQERAEELVRIMGSISLDALYSTNFNRTMQTAEPVAIDQGLTIQGYTGFDLDPLTDNILENYSAGKILVVGHSNTTPSLLNVLTGTNDYPQLAEDQYDHLFIVTVYEKGRAEVLDLRYGKSTP